MAYSGSLTAGKSGLGFIVKTTARRLWTDAATQLAGWRERARSRRELKLLGERDRWDIGISRVDALNEAAKPFWRA